MKIKEINDLNELNIKERNPLKIAIASIFENRIPVFLPVKQTTHLKLKKELDKNGFVVFDTSYGMLEVRGNLLTQTHKNLLEAILSYEKFFIEDNSFYVKFKPYDLLKHKLKKKNPNDYNHLNKLLKELSAFSMVLRINKDLEIGFRFIDDFLIDNKKKDGFYYVKFTRILSVIWENETLYNYSEILPIFDKIKIPVVQALIKFLLTYDNFEINIDELLSIFNLNKIFTTKKSQKKVLDDIVKSFENPELIILYKSFGIYYLPETRKVGINKSNKILTDEILIEIKRAKSFTAKLKEKYYIEKNNSNLEQLSLFEE